MPWRGGTRRAEDAEQIGDASAAHANYLRLVRGKSADECMAAVARIVDARWVRPNRATTSASCPNCGVGATSYFMQDSGHKQYKEAEANDRNENRRTGIFPTH